MFVLLTLCLRKARLGFAPRDEKRGGTEDRGVEDGRVGFALHFKLETGAVGFHQPRHVGARSNLQAKSQPVATWPVGWKFCRLQELLSARLECDVSQHLHLLIGNWRDLRLRFRVDHPTFALTLFAQILHDPFE